MWALPTLLLMVQYCRYEFEGGRGFFFSGRRKKKITIVVDQLIDLMICVYKKEECVREEPGN